MREGWATKPLGELCRIEMGGTPPRGIRKFWDEKKTTDNVWLSIADMPKTLHARLSTSKEHLSDEGAARVKLVKAGTLLVSFKLTLGRLAYADIDLRTNEAIAALELLDEPSLIKEYLYWYLTFFDWQKAAEGGDKVKGKTLNKAKLAVLPVLVPPLSEQQRIVAILDEAFAGLVTATANAEKNLKNARELFDAYLSSIFDRGDKGWQQTALGAEIDLLVGFAFKSAQYTKIESGIRLLRGDNVIQNALRWDDVKRWPQSDVEKYGSYKLKAGDIVLAMDRTWVKAGLKYAVLGESDVPSLLVQRVARLRCREQIDNRFLVHLIGSPKFTRYVLGIQTGLSVPHISGQQISDFAFQKPNILEQRKVGAALDELASNVGALEDAYREKLDGLAGLKQSILQKAFSGELTSPPSQAVKEAAE